MLVLGAVETMCTTVDVPGDMSLPSTGEVLYVAYGALQLVSDCGEVFRDRWAY